MNSAKKLERTFDKLASTTEKTIQLIDFLRDENKRLRAEVERLCPTCQEYKGKMCPSHFGSKNCESGSLASGGTKSHCTCDTCF